MSAHKKFQLKTQNFNSKWLAVDPYMPPWRTGMHNNVLDRLKIQSENGIGNEMLPQFMEDGSRASKSNELKIDYNFARFS